MKPIDIPESYISMNERFDAFKSIILPDSLKQDVLKGRKTVLTISGARGSVMVCCDPELMLGVLMI